MNNENVDTTETVNEGQAETIEQGQLTDEQVNQFLQTNEGKALLQPILDSHFSKSLNSWKTNNLDKIVNEKLMELNPAETPEQRQLRQLQEEMNNLKNEKVKAEIKSVALQEADNIPKNLVDLLITDNIQSTRYNLNLVKNELNQLVQTEVEKRLSSSAKVPTNNQQLENNVNKETFMRMNHKQRALLKAQNPELYENLKG